MTTSENSYTMPLLFGAWPEARALLYVCSWRSSGASRYSVAKYGFQYPSGVVVGKLSRNLRIISS